MFNIQPQQVYTKLRCAWILLGAFRTKRKLTHFIFIQSLCLNLLLTNNIDWVRNKMQTNLKCTVSNRVNTNADADADVHIKYFKQNSENVIGISLEVITISDDNEN